VLNPAEGPCHRRLPSAQPAARIHPARDNADMDILLNGDRVSLPDGCSIAGLLDAQGLAGRRVAVEVNGSIVPRGQHAQRTLETDDRVEIVHALGGG
jgi:sulfur carrier protein